MTDCLQVYACKIEFGVSSQDCDSRDWSWVNNSHFDARSNIAGRSCRLTDILPRKTRNNYSKGESYSLHKENISRIKSLWVIEENDEVNHVIMDTTWGEKQVDNSGTRVKNEMVTDGNPLAARWLTNLLRPPNLTMTTAGSHRGNSEPTGSDDSSTFEATNEDPNQFKKWQWRSLGMVPKDTGKRVRRE